MSSHLSSKDFSAMYELLFDQHNAPVVKFQNPDAWSGPRHTKYDSECARMHFLLAGRILQLKRVIDHRFGLL
jgi:hypothetical protein